MLFLLRFYEIKKIIKSNKAEKKKLTDFQEIFKSPKVEKMLGCYLLVLIY